MLPIPEQYYTSSEVLASWVELCALADDDGFCVRGAATESLRDSTLFDEKSRDDVDTPVVELMNGVWRVLRARQSILTTSWPFEITDDRLTRRGGRNTLDTAAAYTALLLIEAASSKWYASIAIQSGDDIRAWFEHIATASIGALLGGRTIRFGAPFPPDWPTTFAGQVERMAGTFDYKHKAEEIERLSVAEQKDDCLDVVSRWKLGDEAPSSACVLVQCATGANWSSTKTGQPAVEKWKKYVDWRGPIFKGIAVPFALREPNALERASFSHNGAIVFDRIRLCAGNPDALISSDLRTQLTGWCRARFELLSSRQPIVVEKAGRKVVEIKVAKKKRTKAAR